MTRNMNPKAFLRWAICLHATHIKTATRCSFLAVAFLASVPFWHGGNKVNAPAPTNQSAASLLAGVPSLAPFPRRDNAEWVGSDFVQKQVHEAKGMASWYDWDGRTTASGEIMDSSANTCAHKTLPLGSVVEVENLANGRTAQLRVNDRGPYVAGRIVDVTKGVAEWLGFAEEGVARVKVRVISKPNATKNASKEG